MKNLFKLAFFNFIVLVGLIVFIELIMRSYYFVSKQTPIAHSVSLQKEWNWVEASINNKNYRFDPRFVFDENLGWISAPNQHYKPENRELVITNSKSIRDAREFNKTKTKKRIVVVGDSYSFGFGVSNEETYASQLEQSLKNTEVLNMAVSAFAKDQAYLMYKNYGKQYNPDIVVMGFYLPDYSRNGFSFREYLKPAFDIDENKKFFIKNEKVLTPNELLALYQSGERKIGGWSYSFFFAFLQQKLDLYKVYNRNEGAYCREILAEIMRLYKNEVERSGATPIWMIIPPNTIYDPEGSKYSVIGDYAERLAKEMGMPVLNLEQTFLNYKEDKNEARRILWRPEEVGSHLSAEGNKLVAENLAKFISNLD